MHKGERLHVHREHDSVMKQNEIIPTTATHMGLMQVGEVVDAIEDEHLPKVRNLGKKSYVEIQTKLLALGYSKLTDVEKKRFFYDVLERNGVK